LITVPPPPLPIGEPDFLITPEEEDGIPPFDILDTKASNIVRGTKWQIEVSTNLIYWEAIEKGVATDIIAADVFEPKASNRFYRIQILME
jgi:hypothetical protein